MIPSRRQLSNGLPVLLAPLPSARSVAFGLIVKAGSRDEARDQAGLSHMIEHMLFQGTRRRDTRELSRVISAVGGELEAHTSREHTAYYTKVPAEHLTLACDVVSDMVRHSRFDPRHLEKEKQVVLEEIRMVEDEPEEYVHDRFAQCLFPEHPLGRLITGTREQVRRIDRPGLLDFFARTYQPGRLLLALAGRFETRGAMAALEKYFGPLARPRPASTPSPSAPPPAPAQAHVLEHRDWEQVHVCLGVRGMAYADPDRLAALALSNLLGGGPNSRLFYEIREQRALAYSVYTFLDLFGDTGMFGVYLACQRRRLNEALQVVLKEMDRVRERAIGRRELSDLREQLCGNLTLSLESTSSQLWRMIHNEIYLGRQPSLASTFRDIRRLTGDDLLAVGKRLLGQKLVISIAGPVDKKGIKGLNEVDRF